MKTMQKKLVFFALAMTMLSLFGCGSPDAVPGAAVQKAPAVPGPGSVIAGYTLQPGETGVFANYSTLNDASLSKRLFNWARQGTPGMVATYGTIGFNDASQHTGNYATLPNGMPMATTWSTATTLVSFTTFSSASSKTWSAPSGTITVTTPTATFIYTDLARNPTAGYHVVMKSVQDQSGVVFVEYERWYYGASAAANALAFANAVPPAPAKGLNPSGMAVDASGNVYATFFGSASIMKFNNTSTTSVWNAPTAAGPQGIAVDASGAIYVVSSTTNTVMKYTTASKLPVWTASTDLVPTGVAVDATGGIFVVNHGSNTVQMFTTASTVPVWSAPTDVGPIAVALDGNGGIFVANYTSGTIQKFTTASTVPVWTANTYTGLISLAVRNNKIFVVNYNNLFFNPLPPVPPNPPNPYGTCTFRQYSTPSTLPVWGTSAVGAGPRAITMDIVGNLYVANYTDSTVMQFTVPLTFLQVILGVPTTQAPAWTASTVTPASLITNPSPYAIAVDAAGGVYVANWNDSTVMKFAPPALLPVWIKNP